MSRRDITHADIRPLHDKVNECIGHARRLVEGNPIDSLLIQKLTMLRDLIVDLDNIAPRSGSQDRT